MSHGEVRSTIVSYVEEMMAAGEIKPEAVTKLIRFLDDVIEGMNVGVVEMLTAKIQDWEATMGDDDKSLYTLGIRQSIDVFRGESYKHANEYKPLDEEDFRS